MLGVSMTMGAFLSPLRAQEAPGAARPMPPQRTELERRFRERTAEVVRRRLQLNDDQMSRLSSVNQQFDRQRIALVTEERQAREALRAQLMSGDRAKSGGGWLTARSADETSASSSRSRGDRAEGAREIHDAGSAGEVLRAAEPDSQPHAGAARSEARANGWASGNASGNASG